MNAYLQKAYALEQKVFASLLTLRAQALSLMEQRTLAEVEYFHEMLIKHWDLIERRVLKGETIPHADKLFSLFEPHTEWINKGKVAPAVELGHKLLITTDQYSLVLDYKVMDQSSDVKETLPLVDRLLARFGDGQIQSWSVDKGFRRTTGSGTLGTVYSRGHHAEKRAALPKPIRPGKRRRPFDAYVGNTVRSNRTFMRWKHHGLNRCPDKGWSGFQRYVGFGILAYNLHKIGHRLLEHDRRRQSRLKPAA